MAGATQWDQITGFLLPGLHPSSTPLDQTLQKKHQVWSPVSANTEVRLEGTRDRAGSGGLSEGVQAPERVLSPPDGPRPGLNCRGWYRRMQSWVGQGCGEPGDLLPLLRPPTCLRLIICQ